MHESDLPPHPPPPPANSIYPQQGFVGGFRPENGTPYPSGGQLGGASPYGGGTPPAFYGPGPYAPSSAGSHGPPPVPPKQNVPLRMPEPLYGGPSLTTQIALQQYQDQSLPNLPQPPALRPPAPDTPLRPHSDTDVTSPSAGGRPKPFPQGKRTGRSSPGTPPKDQLSVPDTPNGNRNRRKSSPGAIAGTVTCSGTTKSGEPCKNPVKRPTALGHVDSDADKEIERYCHLHLKEVLKPSGFQSSKANEWVNYDDWIPAYLQEDTKAALRVEMNKPASASDRDGYIYTFEIRDQSAPGQVHLKVGRTVNLVKRMDQWSKQCESKEQVLRGYWPGNGTADNSDLMKGRMKVGDPGRFCYRLERLVHLELADLVQNKPYLVSGYPKLDEPPKRDDSPVEKRKCPDCGKTHKEIFTFKRFTSGKNKGREYEVIVKPVVERWGKYVDKYLDGPAASL